MPEHERGLARVDERAHGRAEAPLVLIVDDDPVILGLLAQTLQEEGYAVAAAPHGAAALALLERHREQGTPPPELILLDMRMPVMDGWSFVTAYRQSPGPHAPIIAITAAHDALDRAAEIAAHAVLAKPFDLDELLMAVDLHVGERLKAR